MSDVAVPGSAVNVYEMTAREKTDYLIRLVFEGAIETLVRRIAVDLLVGVPRDDHATRLERLHRFVRDAVPYHRESVEMFHRPTQTLTEGGDCDDHVILLCSLAWSLRYPFHVEKTGDPDDPGGHYTCALGYPPHDNPDGDDRTSWAWYETTVDALPGEWVFDALDRIE
ncbi:MAG TPA: hypothetical protein VN896_07950 [Methylomirabilota bacterium]|jgi:hypothetical protein|nr:hypothetical protein [Methylomirabilota bacterium]